MILATPDDMWTPFKQLQRVVETYLSKRVSDDSLATLELTLQKHKPDFINLLKNSVSWTHFFADYLNFSKFAIDNFRLMLI